MSVALAATLLLSACSDDAGKDDNAGSGSKVPFKTKVEIRKSTYRPADLKVLVGGSVTWINRDRELPHTAETERSTSPTPWDDETVFDTHTLDWGEPYTVTFHAPGTFEFHCSFDNSMSGTVEVVSRRGSG